MGGRWHRVNIEAAKERYLTGATLEEIAKEYGVVTDTVRMNLKKAGVQMRSSAETQGGRQKWHSNMVAGLERSVLAFLAKNGPHVAQGIHNSAWVPLRNMERSYLVCRASDYEDPRSFHKWKITGCGMLALATPGNTVQ